MVNIPFGLLKGSGLANGNTIQVRGVSAFAIENLARSLRSGSAPSSNILARCRYEEVKVFDFDEAAKKWGEAFTFRSAAGKCYVKYFDIFDGNHRYHAIASLCSETASAWSEDSLLQVVSYLHSLPDTAAECLGALVNEIQTVARKASYQDILLFILKQFKRLVAEVDANRRDEANVGQQPTNSKEVAKERTRTFNNLINGIRMYFLHLGEANLDSKDYESLTSTLTAGYITGRLHVAEWLDGDSLGLLCSFGNIHFSKVVLNYGTFSSALTNALPMPGAANFSSDSAPYPTANKAITRICTGATMSLGKFKSLLHIEKSASLTKKKRGKAKENKECLYVSDVDKDSRVKIGKRLLVIHLAFLAKSVFVEKFHQEQVTISLVEGYLLSPQQDVREVLEITMSDFWSDMHSLSLLYFDKYSHDNGSKPDWEQIEGVLNGTSTASSNSSTSPNFPDLSNKSHAPGAMDGELWSTLSRECRAQILLLMVHFFITQSWLNN